jgi:hypothetical protein
VSVSVEPPSSLLLLVGREDFEVPTSFGGMSVVATRDCVAVGVRQDGPTTVRVIGDPAEAPGLLELGEFVIESEGTLSVRDVWSREHLAAGVEPGAVRVSVLGDHDEPGELAFVVRPDA